jgi:hypothetical protein
MLWGIVRLRDIVMPSALLFKIQQYFNIFTDIINIFVGSLGLHFK